MSDTHVLYRFFDADDTLLYIGITKNPVNRFKGHQYDKSWFKHVTRSTMEHFGSRAELMAAEIRAIRTERPKYNRAHALSEPEPIRMAACNVRSTPVHPDASRFCTEVDTRDIRDPEYTALEMPCPECRQLTLYTNFEATRVICTECTTGPMARPISQHAFVRLFRTSFGLFT